jgi:hypothetical protein
MNSLGTDSRRAFLPSAPRALPGRKRPCLPIEINGTKSGKRLTRRQDRVNAALFGYFLLFWHEHAYFILVIA